MSLPNHFLTWCNATSASETEIVMMIIMMRLNMAMAIQSDAFRTMQQCSTAKPLTIELITRFFIICNMYYNVPSNLESKSLQQIITTKRDEMRWDEMTWVWTKFAPFRPKSHGAVAEHGIAIAFHFHFISLLATMKLVASRRLCAL